jgi:hypothetical protein
LIKPGANTVPTLDIATPRPAAAIVATRAAGTFSVERTGDVVRITGKGNWTGTQVDRHFEAVERELIAARTAGAGARVLVDLREAPVQDATAASRIEYWTRRIYTSRDRVAVLAVSCLAKAQLRRIAMIAQRELFVSESAARTWLGA